MASPANSTRPGGTTDPLRSLVGYQLRRASVAMMAGLHAELSNLGLGVVDASVLLVIEDNPGTTQSEIGRTLDIHRANMAPIAAKLARLKLTKRETAGRASLLRLTARGRKVAAAAREAMQVNDDRFLAHLGAAERERLALWLEAIRHTDDPTR